MVYLLLSFVIVFIKAECEDLLGDAAIGSVGPMGEVKELIVTDAK